MDKDLNVKAKIIKLLKANIGQKLNNIGFCNAFFDMVSKTQMTKEKNKQIGLNENLKILYIKRNNPHKKCNP